MRKIAIRPADNSSDSGSSSRSGSSPAAGLNGLVAGQYIDANGVMRLLLQQPAEAARGLAERPGSEPTSACAWSPTPDSLSRCSPSQQDLWQQGQAARSEIWAASSNEMAQCGHVDRPPQQIAPRVPGFMSKRESVQRITLEYLEANGYFDCPIQVRPIDVLIEARKFGFHSQTAVEHAHGQVMPPCRVFYGSEPCLLPYAGGIGAAGSGRDDSQEDMPQPQHQALAIPQAPLCRTGAAAVL